MKNQPTLFLYIAIAIGLFGYIMPWIITPTTPLTLGAYDLAEWASLHPSQPHTSPALLVPLLLRIQLLIITILVAISSTDNMKSRFISLIVIIILFIAQLPPLEFLISASDNINYQQQMVLAVISLMAGIGLIVVKLPKLRDYILIVAIILGVGASWFGLEQAQQLYTLSLQEYTVGFGIWILIVAYVGVALFAGRNILLQKLHIST